MKDASPRAATLAITVGDRFCEPRGATKGGYLAGLRFANGVTRAGFEATIRWQVTTDTSPCLTVDGPDRPIAAFRSAWIGLP